MVVFRWLSLVLIVLALMLLGADIVSTLEAAGGTVVRSLDRVLLLVGFDAKPWVQTKFPPGVANAFLAILSTPGWVTFGIIGVILVLIVPARRARHAHEAPPSPPISH
jgi:hypothetical protein